MKKTRVSPLFSSLLPVLALVLASCSPTENKTDTTTLVSAPSNLLLSRTDSTGLSNIGLTCGCAFAPLVVTGYGDTSKIHFLFSEPLTKDTTLHSVKVWFNPSQLIGSGSDSSWVALYFQDNNYGVYYNLYDTIRVKATY